MSDENQGEWTKESWFSVLWPPCGAGEVGSQLDREVRAGREVRKDQISIQERGPSASTDTDFLLPAL